MSEEAVAALPRHLSGTQKSAILMMLLGADEAADLLKHLNPREVQNLGQAMYSIADVDQGTVNNVLDEFILAAREQTSLGSSEERRVGKECVRHGRSGWSPNN